ncbi:hypothetical protein BST61_g4303 [Cercospora zeina]
MAAEQIPEKGLAGVKRRAFDPSELHRSVHERRSLHGHQGAGVVVKLGPNVQGWQVGDRAGIKPLWDVCHNCEHCWNGRENYCQNGVYTGLVAEGTYRQYLTSPAIYTSRIPEGVPDEVAGPIMCSASTMHRALVDSGLKAGDFVVFPGGGGGVGIQGVQLAKAMGMRPIVIDSGEAKSKLSKELGAEEFIDFKEHKDVAARVKEVAGGVGAHGVLVTAYQAYQDSFSYLGDRIGGRIMCIALPPAGTVTMGTDPNFLVFKNVKVIGTLVGTMQDTAAALEYARRGLLKGIAEAARDEVVICSVSVVNTSRRIAFGLCAEASATPGRIRCAWTAPTAAAAAAALPPPLPPRPPLLSAVASDDDSIHTTPSLRGLVPLFKLDVDSHLHLDSAHDPDEQERSLEPSSAQAAESPPPFSSHGFPAQYFPEPSPEEPYPLTTACAADALTATAPAGPAPPFPFEETESHAAASTVVADTKAALPRDTKDGRSSKDLDDGEPPPPYTEGSSPLEGFTYVMAAAGGAASIITQVQQGGPAPINTALGGGSDENITLELRGTRFTLSRDELLTLPEFVLLSLFPNGLLPDGHMNSYHDGDVYPVDYDPLSLQYMLEFFRNVAQTIPNASEESQGPSSDPHAPNTNLWQMISIKRAASRALLKQDGIFSGLRKSEEPGTTEQHLIEMLTAGGFNHDDTWGHRAAEPQKAVICSIALARLRTDIKGDSAGAANAVGMAQKLLLFWRKPARRCWWEGVELDNVEGVEGKLKVWIRRVWTLEMSVIGLR